jgi:hypothetical protein
MEIGITWWHFGLAVAISAIGFHTALTTDVGERPPAEEAVALIGFRCNGGWILGIGGLILALRVFFTLF